MKNLLITHGTLLTLGSDARVIDDGALYILGEKIGAIGASDDLISRYPHAEQLNARGRVIMPGMICAHHHLYSTMARGMRPPGVPASNFMETLQRLWWKLDSALTAKDIFYSAIIPLMDCIRNGTTTIIDHHASPSCRDGSLDIIEEAVLTAGIRACLCYEVSDRNVAAGGLQENIRFIKKAQNINTIHRAQMTAMMGLHASMTISPKTLETCVGHANDLNVGCHIHVAEDLADRIDSVHRYGVPTVRRLIQAGAGGEKSIFVHCVHIDADEIDLLRESGTAVVHNPESNMNNAVGVSPVLDMMQKDASNATVLVGLGTDGMSSNMFAQTRVAYLLHRLSKRDPRVAFTEAPTMTLFNNPRIANRLFSVTLGELSEGAAADVILIDYHSPTPLRADNVFGHFIFGLNSAPVDTTICRGQILMKNKIIPHLNVEELVANASALAQKLWARIG